MSWSDLFDAATVYDRTESDIRTALKRQRQTHSGSSNEETKSDRSPVAKSDETELTADPMTRVVADAGVLASDILLDGSARAAMDLVRSHDWLGILASEPLLADGAAILRDLTDDSITKQWHDEIRSLVTAMEHPEGDHPAIATAAAGDARHVLSLDPELQSAETGVAIRRNATVETSVRSPAAFVRLFDPADIYEAVYGSSYPGPDQDPRE